MDKIDKFEKILNLVERARRLDFIAIEAMERLNKQHIDFYNFYNKISKDKTSQAEQTEPTEIIKETTGNSNTTENDIVKKQEPEKEKKENQMADHNDALKAFVDAFNNQLNKIKLNPTGPIPPEDEAQPEVVPPPPPPPVQNKDVVMIEKIKGLTGTISDRIKAEADMLKHINSVINETHKMSFAMWKEMDEYLKKTTPSNTSVTGK